MSSPTIQVQAVLPDGSRMVVPIDQARVGTEPTVILRALAAYLDRMREWGFDVDLTGGLSLVLTFTDRTISVDQALTAMGAQGKTDA